MHRTKCPEKYILRKGYITKTGKKVKPNCIKSTSPYKGKRNEWQTKILKEQKKRTKKATKKTNGPKKCPVGQTLKNAYLRKSYIRKNGSVVAESYMPSKCIKKKKSYTKNTKKIILKKGTLGKHGYHNIKSLTNKKRHDALKKAIKELGSLSVMRKINILMIFSRKNKKLSGIYEKDKKWIYKNYHVKAF